MVDESDDPPVLMDLNIDELYAEFLEKLDHSFTEFVQSDAVNAYLQTIGGDVKTEILQDGILHEFLIVTGYEEIRGNWATIYDDHIRFGKMRIPVQGFESPMVLTPNFFYGENKQGEEVEYRMGLIIMKGRLQLHPVIIRRVENAFRGKMLPDLCVIHHGVSIDSESGKILGRAEIQKVTANEQFRACFWNIDDCLRKQNPQFHSDFDTGVWEAVEVFSGRIVQQMLWQITKMINPIFDVQFPRFFPFEEEPPSVWIIPQAEMVYLQNLLKQIEYCLENSSFIAENQLAFLVKNLCCYMVHFKNYEPITRLFRGGLDILYRVIDWSVDINRAWRAIVLNSDQFPPKDLLDNTKELAVEAKMACEKALEVYQKSIIEDSELINNVNVTRILSMRWSLPDRNASLLKVLELYRVAVAKIPQFPGREDVKVLTEVLSEMPIVRILGKKTCWMSSGKKKTLYEHTVMSLVQSEYPVRASALQLYKTVIEEKPHFIDIDGVNAVIKLLPYEGNSALDVYGIILEKAPRLVDGNMISKLLQNFHNVEYGVRVSALKAALLTLEKVPMQFSRTFHVFLHELGVALVKDFIGKPRQKLQLCRWVDTVKIALRSAFRKAPNFVDREISSEIVEVMESRWWQWNPMLQEIASELYDFLQIGKSPNITCKEADHSNSNEMNKILDRFEEVKPITGKKLYKGESRSGKIKPKYITGKDLYEKQKDLRNITLGSRRLDALLGGGIPTGMLTEVHGESETGKTQIAHQLTITTQLPFKQGGLNGSVLYIDCGGTFQRDRVIQITQKFGLDQKEIFTKFFYALARNTEHLYFFLTSAVDLIKNNQIKLIIVDGFLSHFLYEYRSVDRESMLSTIWQKKAGLLLYLLRHIAGGFKLAVFLTNQITFVSSLVDDIVGPEGGPILEHSCKVQLYLRRSEGNQRIAKLVNSPYLPEAETVFKITAHGIEDV